MPKTLKGTLVLTIVSLVVISTVAVTMLASHRYASSQEQLLAAQAGNIGLNLAGEAADLVLINDLVGLQRKLERYQESMPVLEYLFVVRDGRILASTFDQGVPKGLISANSVKTGESRGFVKVASLDGQRFLDLAMPIFEGRAGVLRLGFSEKYLTAQLTRLWKEIIILVIVILVPALLAGLYLMNRITRPLAQLVNAAGKVEPGKFDFEVEVKGQKEIEALSRAFNLMTSRLRDHTAKLEKQALELKLAHQKMQTTCEIARGVSALGDLSEIGTYLIKRTRQLVSCFRYLLIIFSSDKEHLFLITENETKRIKDPEFAVAIESKMQGAEPVEKLEDSNLVKSEHFPEEFAGDSIQVAMPLYCEDTLCGVMLSSCSSGCQCDYDSLDMISLVLSHSTGTIKRALHFEEEMSKMRGKAPTVSDFQGMVARDAKMKNVFSLIRDVAPADATVLIQGESGTGKELVAKAVHNLSERREKPFVVINCSAYPETLLESELFGHEKGAFTSALKQRPGRFEQADGGTVFLDEISEIDPSAQVKLLRVLQTQTFERLGGQKSIKVNVRVLAATNKVLLDEVKAGRFREDLYYRLDVVPLFLPPLRERGNDVALLSRHFLGIFIAELSKNIRDISSQAMRALLDYDWPGNVRELENVIEQAVVLCKGEIITPDVLPERLREKKKSQSKGKTINEQEKTLLLEALEACSWNKKMTAERLGIGRSTLYAKLKKHEIKDPSDSG
ncbi:MAG: sigma 54-interacting transcriptional regulator [Desulfonatronovibrio sp.]